MNHRFRDNLPTVLFLAGLLVWASPSLVWYVRRMMDGSDEPFGILALAVWAAFLLRHFAKHRCLLKPLPDRIDGAVALATAAALYVAPNFPLLHGGILVGFVSCMAIRRGAPTGLLGLGLLSLPVIATLEFYFGFPLRFSCGWLGAGFFQLFGMPVRVEGISMWIDSTEIVIDRPCSGLKYLWFGWFVTALAGSYHQLSGRRFLLLALASGLTLFLANTLRINLLFLLEWKDMGGEAVHEWIGLAVFALALAVILSIANHQSGKQLRRPLVPTFPKPNFQLSPFRGMAFGVAWCILAAVGLFPEQGGQPGSPLPTVQERSETSFGPTGAGFARLLSSAQGEPSVYESDGAVILLRKMDRPSRSVHSAEDCFRGAGYTIEHASLWKDPYERNWRRFYATRMGQRWEVRQRIEGVDGWSGSDVSQWFWNATTGQAKGPWSMWVVVTEA